MDNDTTIRLIVKGDNAVATHAAQQRGIALTVLREVGPASYAVGWATGEHIEAVRAWFNDGQGVVPYPAGTLLHFAVIEQPEPLIEPMLPSAECSCGAAGPCSCPGDTERQAE